MHIFEADYNNPDHVDAILHLLDLYSRDPMGQQKPLSAETCRDLISGLKSIGTAFTFIAQIDHQPAGLINCFTGFSTFKAKPLVNIHDVVVSPEFREQGVGNRLLNAVEQKAREMGCCKLTLEVRDDNRAKNLYERYGFDYGTPAMYFMTMELG